MVTKPSRGSRMPRSRRCAMISRMRSATLAARGFSPMAFSCLSAELVASAAKQVAQGAGVGCPSRVDRGRGPRSLDSGGTSDTALPMIAELAARLLDQLDRLDLVTDLDVVELAETDTGLEVRLDLGDVVLEPAQRLDGEVVAHHDAVADDACLRVARDRSAAHDDTRDVAELRGAEHLADLGDTRLHLFVLGLEHALERGLDVVERGVDHGVEAHVDALARGALAGLDIRTDVEADDDRVVDRRQVDVGLGDGAHTAVQDAQLNRVVDLDLEQRLLERLDGTGDVTLDDEVERIDLALFECTGEVLERDALAGLGQL